MTALVLENVATNDLAALAAMKENIDNMIAKLKADQVEEKAQAKIAAKVAKIEAKAAAKQQAAIIRAAKGETRGRPDGTATFDNKWAIVEGLRLINEANQENGHYHYNDVGAACSRTLTLQLVDRGYLEAVKMEKSDGERGRAKLSYRLTNKGKTYLTFSARWKQPQ